MYQVFYQKVQYIRLLGLNIAIVHLMLAYSQERRLLSVICLMKQCYISLIQQVQGLIPLHLILNIAYFSFGQMASYHQGSSGFDIVNVSSCDSSFGLAMLVLGQI